MARGGAPPAKVMVERGPLKPKPWAKMATDIYIYAHLFIRTATVVCLYDWHALKSLANHWWAFQMISRLHIFDIPYPSVSSSNKICVTPKFKILWYPNNSRFKSPIVNYLGQRFPNLLKHVVPTLTFAHPFTSEPPSPNSMFFGDVVAGWNQ